MVTANLGLAHVVAKRRARLCGVEAEDLLQEAVLILMRAAELYQPDRGFRFSTYAWTSMQRRMRLLDRRDTRRVDRPPSDESTVTDLAVTAAPAPDVPAVSLASLTERERFVITRRYGLDSAEGEVDLSHLVGRGVFARWTDPAEFAQVRVDPSTRTVRWPGDIDLDPDVLYARATGRPIPVGAAGPRLPQPTSGP